MTQELKLAELLCTRLCHDLTGPIGAIANGAEFLSEEGFDLQGQAIELINSSANQAVARLQFYRKAYGRINEDGEADLAELKKLVADFLTGGKVTLDWPDMYTNASGVSVSYKMGRLLLNMVIISVATLLRGGSIAVRVSADDKGKEMRMLTTGATIKWDKEIDEALSGRIELSLLTPKTVQADLTRQLAVELGANITWNISESSAEIILRKPS